MSSRRGHGWAGARTLVFSPSITDPSGDASSRRLHFLCRRLKERGAEVHLLHYPVGMRRLHRARIEAHRRMVAEWDAFHLVPARADFDHAAEVRDRLWDSSASLVLEWLFQVQTIDVLLVTSPWISRAFEFCPPDVARILDARDGFALPDTHARYGGGEALLGDDEKRRLLIGADTIWSDIEGIAELQRLAAQTVSCVTHAEPLLALGPSRRRENPKFGLVVGEDEEDVAASERFLEVAADYIRETLLPAEFLLAGGGAGRFRREDYPFARTLPRADGARGYPDIDVALALAPKPWAAEGSVLDFARSGKAIVSLAGCWEPLRADHRYHELGSFLEIMRACEAIVATPDVIADLEAASIVAMTRASRIADRTLDAAALRIGSAEASGLPTGFIFVIAAEDVWNGSFVLDHVCEAALFVSHQAAPAFFLIGAAKGLEVSAASRLRALGGIVLSRECAASLEPGALDRLEADVASFDTLVAGRPLAFWFTCVPSDLPGSLERASAMAFAPLAVLTLARTEADVLGFVIRLQRHFSQVVAFDVDASRLYGAVASEGAETHMVPALWCGEASAALEALSKLPDGPVTLFANEPSGTLLELALETARRSTNRRLEVVYDDRTQLAQRPDAREQAVFIPFSSYLGKERRRRFRPWIAVELGHAPVFAAIFELLERAGVPRIGLFRPDAPLPVVAGRRTAGASGVMESAIFLDRTLRDEDLVAALAARCRRRTDALDDAGWNLIWDWVRRAKERAAGAVSAGASGSQRWRPVRAEILVNVQGRGAYRFGASGWTEARGAIEAFGVRPLEKIARDGLEYMAIGPQGQETPWVTDAKLCGTRDQGLALGGFAVRPAPHLRRRFEIEYEGLFRDLGAVGPKRNGEICASPRAADPLIAMSLKVLERIFE